MSRRTALWCATLALGIGGLISGCGGSSPTGSSGGSSDTATTSSRAPSGTIHVFAAASLTEAFTTLGKQFERTHHGVSVVFNFGASSTLAQQINAGAPADVFASASTKNMAQVVSAGGARNPATFAKNAMEIAVPPDNPAHLSSVNDLARNSTKVALCQIQVPCGVTAEKIFSKAGISVKPVTREADVKSVLSKVELGEVDAGIVYVTDVRAAVGKVLGVRIPDDVNASTTYPLATLTDARNPVTAQAFVAYVLSSAGRSVLTADGFLEP